ncbi:MAG: electron transfer flavoprotein subunit alpha/FixB family protein [bacterium]|jgi:electron transfer flavoprotein alpha subunit
MPKSLVVPEITAEGKIRKVGFELVSAAKSLDGNITAFMAGQGAHELAGIIGDAGVEKVYSLEDAPRTGITSAKIASALASVVNTEKPEVVLFGFTTFGRDISARLAAMFDCGLIDDATGLELGDDGRIVATKPLYAGKIVSKCRLRGTGMQVFSVRPNTFPAAELIGGKAVVIPLEPVTDHAKDPVFKSFRPKEAGEVDLKEAQVIISGGRAVKGPEGFEPIKRIARRFGWAMGASRATVDAGWIPHSYQVGQTGKTVNPKLYIACGISGAIQHLAGMQTSKVIVAINTDPEAPIFKIADYGIVGDIFTILPLLEDELAKVIEA